MANVTLARAKRQAIAGLAGCALLSGLALDAARAPADAADQVKIGISRTISDAGYYMADAMGFFRDEGIDVSITGFNSAAQMIAPLGTGELDVGGGTVSAGFYNAVGRGILMKIVADQASIKPGYGYSSLMVRKDLVDSGRYKSFADLKGMKVAIGAPGTGTASALNEALKKGGLKYSDVDVVYIGFPEHLPTYKNKGIDASITNEPTMTRAIEDGVAVRVAGNDVTYPDQQTAVTFYSDNFIRNRRDVAERFMRAYLRGVRMYNDALKDGRLAGPKANEVIPILVKYTTIKDESMFRRMVPSYCNPDGEVNVTSLKKDLEFFRELGLIEKKDASVDGVVDSSFAKAAVAKLGPYRAHGQLTRSKRRERNGAYGMTTREQNDFLTQSGPGTPIGNLFRRYWIPALLSAEVPEPDCPPVRVKLLSERLLAFRDTQGRVGVIDEFCAHRGVSLWFGRNEENGLRCSYHGWKYDVTGQCIEVPSEPEASGFCKKIKLTSYPCVELGDVIWIYMGPAEHKPPLPAFEWAKVPHSHRFVSKRTQECNYLQAMEGGIDSAHVSFLHRHELRSDSLHVGKGAELTRETDARFEVVETTWRHGDRRAPSGRGGPALLAHHAVDHAVPHA